MKITSQHMRRRRLFTRLITLNLLGLIVLVGGILALNQSRQTLTNTYKQNLLTQARLMASVLSDTVAKGRFQFLPGPSLLGPRPRFMPDLASRRASLTMRKMASATQTRALLYVRSGQLLVDSNRLSQIGRVEARRLPLLDAPPQSGLLARAGHWLGQVFRGRVPELKESELSNGLRLPEFADVLQGRSESRVRQDSSGRDILTVAVPVQNYRAIIGVLVLTTKAGEIDALVRAEREAFFEVAFVALLVSLMTSILLASTLTEPVRRLANAARAFTRPSPILPQADTIPDLSRRRDEIGDLSLALRHMTSALLDRINMIDRFAADVAHELKNPLTSLHSAVQSLARAKNKTDRDKLAAIVEQDVGRLNRLITDIANATRVDAELNRGAVERFDLAEFAREMGEVLAALAAEKGDVTLEVRAAAQVMVAAQRPRIAQIIDNLITNALSFSPTGGRVILRVDSEGDMARLVVSDEGPGLAPDTRKKIFERFYSDRPPTLQADNAAGHSGLGLSISRQIARAHGGDLRGDNRPDGGGAYFTLTLPRAAADG